MLNAHSEVETARERLLDLAGELVEQRGSPALTMAELAARAGMAPANLTRYFTDREALLEAMAERWFAPKIEMIEAVVESDLPPRRKMYEFFARRFVLSRDRFLADPIAFENFLQLGEENFAVVQGYVDLADHYLAQIIGEAMADGHFAALSLDEALSLVNQMAHLYCNSALLKYNAARLSEDKLARIIDAVFDGLSGEARGARPVAGLRAA